MIVCLARGWTMKEQSIECRKQLRLCNSCRKCNDRKSIVQRIRVPFEVLKAEILYRNMKRRNLYLKKAGFD